MSKKTFFNKQIVIGGLFVYVGISCIVFGYFGYKYINGVVYQSGYDAAIKDIADTSLSTKGCEEGVVLGLGNDKYTYVKNLQCPTDNPESSQGILDEDPALNLPLFPAEQE